MSFFEKRAKLLEMSTESGQLEYEKGSHSTGEGDRYEEGCLALVFLRCVREGLQFTLSSNDTAGGKFDDLVLCWNNESRSVSALFVQLKHKTSARQTTVCKSSLLGLKRANKKKANKKYSKENTDFSITKYYDSYKEMRECLDGGSYALVLYTNIDLDKDAQHLFVKQNPESVLGMRFLDSGGCIYRLNPNDDDVKHAVNGDNRFIANFYLFCNQSNNKLMKDKICTELKQMLEADDKWSNTMSENLCSSLREWMNSEKVCLTSSWKRWLKIIDTYIKAEVTACNSMLVRIKYRCVETLQAHMRSCNPAWIRPPGKQATALTATKVHQIISGEKHIMVNATRLHELKEKILCCWGPFCRWLILLADAEHTYEPILYIRRLAGPNRRLVIVSYEGNDSFQDTCKSNDIHDESWKEFLETTINLNSGQYLCTLENLCDTEGLKAILDGKPEALVALSQRSGALRMGQELDPLPVNHICRELMIRRRIRQEFFLSLGDKEVCITDEASYKYLTKKSVWKYAVKFEELENHLKAPDTVWPLFSVISNIDRSAVEVICSKYADIPVYVLIYADNGWELLFLHRGRTKIRGRANIKAYVEEQSRSVLQVVDGLSNRVIVEGKPGVGKSTMLLELGSQLKRQNSSWWILRIDLLKYSEIFDNCVTGFEASKAILDQVVYNKENLGILERTVLQYCLQEYPRIICMVDGFDEVCPDYAVICLKALQELAPRRGQLVVTTRPSVTDHLEDALGVLSHSLPAFSEAQLHNFHGWSYPETGITDVVRDLLKIPLFSRMYVESLGSGIMVDDIVSLYEAFFDKKLRRLHVEKWGENLSTAGKKKLIERERQEYEKQLGFLAVSHLLPKLKVPRHLKLSCKNRTELLKAGVIYKFVRDKPIFIHRTFAEHFLATWCLSNITDSLCVNVYRKALSDRSLEFFVESFDRMASRVRPLLGAVLNGIESEVKSLLENGADPMEVDVMGRNSLHLAAMYSRDSALLRLLVEWLEVAGASRAARSASGPSKVIQKAVEPQSVLKVDEKGGTSKSEIMASDSQLAKPSGKARGWGAGEMVGAAEVSQYVEAMRAVTVVVGAEDRLLHWTPLRYAAERWRWRAVATLLELGAQLHHLGDFQRGVYSGQKLWDIFLSGRYADVLEYLLLKKESAWRPEMVQQRSDKRCREIEVGLSIVCAEMSSEEYTKIQHQAKLYQDMVVAKILELKLLYTEIKSTSFGHPSLVLHQGSNGSSQLNEYRQMPVRDAGIHSRTFQQPTLEGDGVIRRDAVGETMLHHAARRNDVERLRQLIETGCGVNMKNNKGESALHLAAKMGNGDCIKLLHSAEADISERDENGRTPLHYAAKMGRVQTVRLLLMAGADPLAQDSKCRTPLHVAALWGNPECVRLLTYTDVNLGLRDRHNFSALGYAAWNQDDESLKHLLRACARNTPVKDILNEALYEAAGRGNAECVRLLVQEEADVTSRSHSGCTALHFAAYSGNKDCLRYLLALAANINEKNVDGNTPLHCAAEGGNPACVRMLLEQGADVNVMNNSGETPLHKATEFSDGTPPLERLLEATRDAPHNLGNTGLGSVVAMDRFQIVKLLLDAGADALAQDSLGFTPLHWAATRGSTKCVELMAYDVKNLELTDWIGRTALHCAARFGNSRCLRHLLRAGAHNSPVCNILNTPLHEAAKGGYSDGVRQLLRAEADVTARNADGKTALHLAAENIHPDCVTLLLKAGAGIQEKDKFGDTPLHCAVKTDHPDPVRLLVQLVQGGSDLHARNNDGDTPLHLASKSFHTKSVRILLKAGARVATQNNRGDTPLHYAANAGKTEIARLLLEAGADIEQVNEEGHTPIDCASRCANGECFKLLSVWRMY